MYKGLKISIAVATYNGERFIREQLESMCLQSVKPDEIVLSDDGSNDNTIRIIENIKSNDISNGIDIVILKDNLRHGYCGNFEWAIKHTHGNLVFISDQDDLWFHEKIKTVSDLFIEHPDAECVIHEANLIDKDGNCIEGIFNEWTKSNLLNKGIVAPCKIEREKYLENSISSILANGMVLCIRDTLLIKALPFPKTNGYHDGWLNFVAVCDDACWYTPEILAGYRLHENNTCGNRALKTKAFKKIFKIKNKLKIQYICDALERYYLGSAYIKILKKFNINDFAANGTARRIYDIGKRELDAAESGRIVGAYKLTHLYCTDIRYRRCGRMEFLYQLFRILIYSKKQRRLILNHQQLQRN